jgi:hypothetical protein
MADEGGSEGEGQDRINRLVALIIDGGYNLGMPSVRLTIVVHQDQVASLDRRKRGHFWRRLALLLEAFRKEPFPLVRRRFSERT